MHADYIANPLYDNNPFIEALPPMLSGRDLIHALAVIPPYSDNDRDRSTGERLQLSSSLYEFYQPLSMTIDLYCEIYTAMQHCYVPYSAAVRHGRKDCGKMGETVRAMILSAIVYNGSCISMLPLFPYLPPSFYYFYVLFSSHRIPFESR